MSEFVDECRREWRRLGVADPTANEMAADLTADLDEAEAEGGSPEDVLGNSAFDPRRFAASWAAARGVTGPPTPERPSPWRSPVAVGLTALAGVLAIGSGLALLSGRSARAVAFAGPVAIRRIAAGGGSIRFISPGSIRIALPAPAGPPLPPFIGMAFGGPGEHLVAIILLTVGIVGLGVAGAFWIPRSGSRRFRRRHEPPNPSWN